MSATYLAGYDGSDAAAAAVRFAKRLAEPVGGATVAVTVYHPAPHVYSPGASRAADAELTRELADQARATQAALDVDVDVDGVGKAIEPGRSVAAGLHARAERDGAAMLVVGTTHRGALGRLVPGSVGERLLHGSPCPVAVVPPAWSEGPSPRSPSPTTAAPSPRRRCEPPRTSRRAPAPG